MKPLSIATIVFVSIATVPGRAAAENGRTDERYADHRSRTPHSSHARSHRDHHPGVHRFVRQQQQQQQQQHQQQFQGIRNAGNVTNAGNNTGTSRSTSSAAQTNANTAQGNTTHTVVGGDVYQAQKRNPVSTASAPALTSGMDTCMGSTSFGAQGVGFGASFGGTWTDDNCIMLKNATFLWNIGRNDAAEALICGNEKMREALELTGKECPQTAKARQTGRSAAVTHDPNDPYIASRLKRDARGN